MLASALLDEGRMRGVEVQMCGRAELDITDGQQVRETLARLRPEIVFHTAALTRVNLCEERQQEAWRVNVSGTSNVAAGASDIGAKLIYFSTDYVFDGRLGRPYVETDRPNPINVYGQSKLRGERFVEPLRGSHIVRTSGVFGPRLGGFERNFFRAVYEQLTQSSGTIPVVDTQTTCVSYAPYLARILMALLDAQRLPPLVHLTSYGTASWFSWAQEMCRALGRDVRRIVPVRRPVDRTLRPEYSALASQDALATQLMREYTALEGIKTYAGHLTGVGYIP